MSDTKDLLEVTKMIVTINSGVIVVSIAFIKDLFLSLKNNKLIRWSWVILMFSTFLGVIGLNWINDRDGMLGWIIYSLCLSAIGIGILMFFILKAVDKSTEETLNNDIETKSEEDNSEMVPTNEELSE